MVFKKLSDKVTKKLFIFAPAYKTICGCGVIGSRARLRI